MVGETSHQNAETSVRNFYTENSYEPLKPFYDNFPYFIKDRCKNSLAYAINFYDEKLLLRLYESAIPVFDPPNNMSMKQFYVTAWECLFPGEIFLINNPEEYVEISYNDLYTK